MGASKYLPHYKSSGGKWVLGLHIYISFKLIINGCQFAGTDKYESNNIGDGQTDGQTITEVRTGNIYESV